MFEHYYYYSINIGNFFIVLGVLIPIFSAFALIIWRVAKLDSRVKQNTIDIKGLADKYRDKDEQYAQDLRKLSEKIDKFGNTLSQVTTSIKYIEKGLEEFKTCLHRLEMNKN